MAMYAASPEGSSNKPRELPKNLDRPNKARLISIIDLGHQPGFTHNGTQIESAYKYEFGYELVNSLMEDGRPHCVWEKVKRSDYEPEKGKSGFTSTMMARVRAIDPENETKDGKDILKLLGKPCVVVPTLDKNGWVKINGQAGVYGVMEDDVIPPAQNEIFSFDMDNPNMEVWNSFSDFKKNMIRSALNFEHSALGQILAEEENTPF